MDSTFLVFIGVLAILGTISLTTSILKRQSNSGFDPLVLDKFTSCVKGWWWLFAFVAAAFYVPGGKYLVTGLFGAMSFWAMREFITLIPTRQADHRTLFFLFFLCIPAQYILVGGDFYDIYSVLIPSFIFLLIPMLIAMFGDTKFYLTRITQICVSLLICVYSLSFVPALLTADMEPAVPQTEFLQTGSSLTAAELREEKKKASDLLSLEIPRSQETAGYVLTGELQENAEGALTQSVPASAEPAESVPTETVQVETGSAVGPQTVIPEEAVHSPNLGGTLERPVVSGSESSLCPAEMQLAETAGISKDAEIDGLEDPVSDASGQKSRKPVDKIGLLLFFFLTTQLSEIFPFLAGLFCKIQHPIAPAINLSKTWEGLAFSLVGTTFAGSVLYFIMPFNVWSCGIAACLIALMGFGGTLTLSAIKRDRGVRDYGTLVVGHDGILDRIDSICFAAPVFFHIVQIYLHFPNIFWG